MSYDERGSPLNGFGGRDRHLQPRAPQMASPPSHLPPHVGRHVRFAPTPQSPATPNGYQLPSPATVQAARQPQQPPPPPPARPTTLERPPSPMPRSPLYDLPSNDIVLNGNAPHPLLPRDHDDDADDRVEVERADLQFLTQQEQEERYQSRRRYQSESGAGNKRGESSVTGMLNNFSRALGESEAINNLSLILFSLT